MNNFVRVTDYESHLDCLRWIPRFSLDRMKGNFRHSKVLAEQVKKSFQFFSLSHHKLFQLFYTKIYEKLITKLGNENDRGRGEFFNNAK